MPLLGPLREEFVNILCECFPDHNKLVAFVRYRLTEDVYRDFAAPSLSLKEIADRLIDVLDNAGLLVGFVKLVQKEFPQHSAKLREIQRTLVTSPKPKAIEQARQR